MAVPVVTESLLSAGQTVLSRLSSKHRATTPDQQIPIYISARLASEHGHGRRTISRSLSSDQIKLIDLKGAIGSKDVARSIQCNTLVYFISFVDNFLQ